jgi:hypothetical protein
LAWLFFWRPPCVLRRVTCQLSDDSSEALEGLLASYRGGWLTLRDVTAIRAGNAPEKLAGDAVVHRSKISFLQVAP